MNKLNIVFASILLFGCATSEKYDEKLNSFVGKNQSVLFEQWGKPSAKKILSPSDEVVTYTKANNVYVPSEFYVYNQGFEPSEDIIYSPFMNDYDFSPYAQNWGYQVEYICQTSFFLQNGIVNGWKWKGNDCISY